MKNLCNMDLKEAETHNIMEITHSRDNTPVSISTEGNELMRKVLVQNFVPVVDDRDNFIGIVTRRSILREYMKSLGIEV